LFPLGEEYVYNYIFFRIPQKRCQSFNAYWVGCKILAI